MLRLGRLLKLGAIPFVCLVARIGSFRSPYRGKILLEPALRIDMCNGASLSDKLAHDIFTTSGDGTSRRLMLSIKHEQCLGV